MVDHPKLGDLLREEVAKPTPQKSSRRGSPTKADLEAQQAQLQAALTSLQEQYQVLEAQLGDRNDEVQRLQHQLSQEQGESQALEQQLSDRNDEIERLEAQVSEQQKQLEALASQLEQFHDLEKELEEAKETIRNLTAPVPKPYRFEDIGFKPMVNYIPEPSPEDKQLKDTDMGWFD
ncbi:hypothetical protein L3556_13400 [Candidatus Synechococcus calcipolaris G9]|uniref:Uncharacterized protein n=1 Tax=Candidatus Synechococcus calcipolaris G9 TaxID=1497997 RepID=A0ABT6F248_9SYNE|nr:hypothetical protein [Candidatus Synechococcus calcipolaris]MDG2991919.1 hypothetical protein [Candidatus Synechococcus calcipolaris G9]